MTQAVFALLGVLIGGLLTAVTEWFKQLTIWNHSAASAIADLELFWPLADPTSVNSQCKSKPIADVYGEIKGAWNPIWRELEIIHAGHPRKKVREAGGAAIRTIRRSLSETESLNNPDSRRWREGFKDAYDEHRKASVAIDDFQASLHRKRDADRLVSREVRIPKTKRSWAFWRTR